MNSFHEGTAFNKDGRFAFCIVVSVNAERRTYRIRTQSRHPSLNDLYLNDVQALTSFTSPDGDEDGALVEAGTTGIVGFNGDTPVIFGFFNPVQVSKTPEGAAKTLSGGKGNDGAVPGSAAGNRESLDPGDKCVQTKGRCKIIWRRSGILEIEASKTCRSIYFPKDSRLLTTVRNYEFTADGYSFTSINVPGAPTKGTTYSRWAWRDNVSPTNWMTWELGTVSPDDSTLFEKRALGPYSRGATSITNPTWVLFRYVDGSFKEAIGPGGSGAAADKALWYHEVAADGTETWSFNGGNREVVHNPDGSSTLRVKKDALVCTVSSSGEISWEQAGAFSAKVKKAVEVAYGPEFAVKGDGGEFIRGKGGKLALGNATVELVALLKELTQLLATDQTPGYSAPLKNAPKYQELSVKLQTLLGG